MTEDKISTIAISVQDVTKENFIAIWPSLIYAIKSSTFIALDLELSGLGNRQNLKASSIEDRYKALSSIAKTRSVISLGLACFEQINREKDGTKNKQKYKVQIFNFLLLCNDEYTVESQALRFLVSHGFDFNKQYSLGIPYSKEPCHENSSKVSIQQLMAELILANKPVVLHNGFIDLVFLYECFYTNLPSALQTFVADLCDIFKAGIFDTKYISEFHSRENLSVLEYLFGKCQYRNHLCSLKNDGAFIEIESTLLQVHNNTDVIHCNVPSIEVTDALKKHLPLICKNFQMRGFCPSETSCPHIHSVELIIADEDLAEEKQRNRRRKRKRKSSGTSVDIDRSTENLDNANGIHCSKYSVSDQKTKNVESSDVDVDRFRDKFKLDVYKDGKTEKTDSVEDKQPTDPDTEPVTRNTFESIVLPRLQGHRAGFDAFMTGFCFAYYRLNLTDSTVMEEACNKIYLTAKDIPLHIVKSHFAKTSLQHQKIMVRIHGEDPS